MKFKTVIIAFLIMLGAIGSANAATDVTGEIYGEVIATITMKDAGIPYGVTIDDINFGEDCDNTMQTCFIKGFSWADKTGWTYWDGKGLQSQLGAGVFPNAYIAKAMYNGNLGGYIWGEKFGWVSLSACDGLGIAACTATYCNWTGSYCEVDKSVRVPEVSAQDANNWGAYIDFCPLKTTQPACESADSNPYCNWDAGDGVCVFDSVANPNGQPLRGYAWSQYLGWIKFGPEAGDTEFTGAFTKWFPDLTPPVLKALNTDNAWIPNSSATGTISWPEFADENDSSIDTANSFITVNTDTGADFAGCPSVVGGPYQNGDMIISQGGDGAVNLSFPEIGLIGAPPHGFCKYMMGGVIYNGSGFGYYFGPEGAAAAAADGVNILSPAPSTYAPNPVTLYVRAGDLDLSASSLIPNGAGAVADGNDIIDITFSPRDIGGNPIIAVKSALIPGVLPEPVQASWVRDVEILYDLSDNSDFGFDRIDPTRNLGTPAPIDIESQTYSYTDSITYPFTGVAASLPHSAGDYLLGTVGFAPTASVGNILELNDITINTVDATLPALSPVLPAIDTSSANLVDNSSVALPANPLPYSYNFIPALEVTGGNLNADFIVLGQPVEAAFNIINNSSDDLGEYSFDHILNYTNISGGIGKEVLEINSINLNGTSDTAGRTDPDSAETRYGLLRGSLNDQGINQFHSASRNYHPPIYNFNSNTNTSGIYQVDGTYYVSPDDPCRQTSSCPSVSIDRSDFLGSDLASGSTNSYTFGFTPSQFLGQALSAQVEFGITQYMAYHAPSSTFPQFAIYPANAYIDGIEVKSIGLGTSGTVGGGQVYETVGGRDLDIVSTTSSADLRREIRKNVASLTRTISPCPAPQSLTSLTTTHGGCIAVNDNNKTVVAVYSGPGTIDLGTGLIISIPDYRYTIILLDGADLNIRSNISYGAFTGNSLGMIVMQDANGSGGNVYIDPAPTNIVGLLYAEGSLLSRNTAGQFYYGAGGNANDLKNQLYWQGSIASYNTIGGGPNKVVPQNVSCIAWGNDVANCSQAYDLDFIRRFATINDTGVVFAPAGYLFSGGGSCEATAPNPNCSLGSLPTTVSLTTGLAIDTANSKSLDTFFIERDNRPVPPGFSSSGGLTSSQEIR
ncbi:hypothetical protein KJ657_04360 [Patescibacteria group bacterium]|nr:hypothetical protein [Patescibacteria group bacterium]MBU1016297.1 hypothetical protein [Patescibacteria group bacterium]MBU1685573.1 hypothetical protein [Patescibacteria group bacterium]MBU1938498.1 hypothetical protein [Patescibacteria group bacterium]